MSVAVTEKVTLVLETAVPLKRPPDVRVKPVGKLPAVTVNVYGEEPPLAVSCWL